MKNHLLITAIVCIAVGGASFYGGMSYASAKQSDTASARRAQFQGAGGFAQGQGGQGRGGAPGGRAGAFGNMINGEVLSKDDKSLTVKLRDGGSKIVFYTDKTVTRKSIDGSMQDIAVGSEVMVNGPANADGSVTAQMVQLRPANATGTQMGAPTAPEAAPGTRK